MACPTLLPTCANKPDGSAPFTLCANDDVKWLAMSDPNNIAAIEEVQFLVHRMVEPAVAPKASIRKALNQLDEFLAEANRQHKDHKEDKKAPTAGSSCNASRS